MINLKSNSHEMSVDLLKKILKKYRPTRTTFEAERMQERSRVPLVSSTGRVMDHIWCKPENTIRIVIELENLDDDDMKDIIKKERVEVE